MFVCLFIYLGFSFNDSHAAQSGIYEVADDYVNFDYKQYSDNQNEAIYYFLYDLKYSGSEIAADNILARSLRENYDNMIIFKNKDKLTIGFVDEEVLWNSDKGGLVGNGTASGQFGNLNYYVDGDKIYISNSPTHVFGTYDGLGRGMEFVGSSYNIYDTNNTLVEKETDLKTSYLFKPRFKSILDSFNVTIDSIIGFISLGVIACGLFFLGWLGIRKLKTLICTSIKRGKIKV